MGHLEGQGFELHRNSRKCSTVGVMRLQMPHESMIDGASGGLIGAHCKNVYFYYVFTIF